jgi:hypothetical protein
LTAAGLAEGLGLRRVGRGWRGPCPIHGGTSFTLTDKGGKALFTCWSCGKDGQGAILAELRRRGLWPTPEKRDRPALKPEQKAEWARRRRRAEALASEALSWQTALVTDLESAKRTAYFQLESGDETTWDNLIYFAAELERVRGLNGAALAEGYLTARREWPAEVAALVAGERRYEQAARRLCAFLVARLVRNEEEVRRAA